jgi:hypothetical protein
VYFLIVFFFFYDVLVGPPNSVEYIPVCAGWGPGECGPRAGHCAASAARPRRLDRGHVRVLGTVG